MNASHARRQHAAWSTVRRSPYVTVRTRLLTAVVLLGALTVLIAGAAAYALQMQSTDERIDRSLRRAVEVLHIVADDGPTPETAADAEFGSVEQLLNEAVRRHGLTENQGVIALLDGVPRWLTSDLVMSSIEVLHLEDDDELIELLGTVSSDAPVELRTVETTTAQYRLVAVPVTITGDPRSGLFVVAVDRSAEIARLSSTYLTYATVALGSLLVITVVAWFVVGRLLSPVRLLRDTARRITESDLSERITVSGTDDLSDLAATVNAMLDRLENAFGSQRELLDDVGHELRTPLTIVRGHLELMNPRDVEDVLAVQALALDELDRMHRLVDDLMTLATADRPDFVRLAPTDIGRLTDDVLDKARGLGERHWQITARADVVLLVDSQRITQAWLQLIANAVSVSAPGTRIRIGSELRAGRVRLWVHDQGPGVPVEEEQRIFERFHRGRADRAGRRSEGAGLGLPIVAAIAAAHRGRVRLERWPAHAGPGAVFLLDLPAVHIVHTPRVERAELVEHR
ncbi:sensor histidine kinase [Cellulomonas sp. P22]|uniref:sensor histidine kinase n=1 Tax=Cellulomonas sp. P22 TaxID=3373189 RepID=UPI0037AED865